MIYSHGRIQLIETNWTMSCDAYLVYITDEATTGEAQPQNGYILQFKNVLFETFQCRPWFSF